MRVVISCLIVCAAVLFAAQPQTEADFKGSWKAIMIEGNLIPPYLAEEIRIEQKGGQFVITGRGEKPSTFRFAVDGKEHLNTAKGLRVRTTAKWEGPALSLTSTIVAPDGKQAKALERWTISPNGKKLAMQGYFDAGQDKKNQLLEYDRQ